MARGPNPSKEEEEEKKKKKKTFQWSRSLITFELDYV
jgi:hypothetical protein